MRTIGMLRCMMAALVLVVASQAAPAAPVDVQIWGRSFRVDPHPEPDEMDKRPLSALVASLPSDLAPSPGFQPTNDQILAEVEERAWIAQFRSEDAFQALVRKNQRADEFALAMSFYAGRGGTTSPEMQKLMDARAALSLLARGLRHAIGKPEEPNAGFLFTLPQLPPEVTASYQRQGFDPSAAYAGFHTVKAAYRSGDLALVARVMDFPLALNGPHRGTIRNATELASARDVVLSPPIQQVVAKQNFNDLFVRDQGAMFGKGEIWIGPGKIGNKLFQVKTINVP